MAALLPSLTKPIFTGVPVAVLVGPSAAAELPPAEVLVDDELLPPPQAAVTTATHAMAAKTLRPNVCLARIEGPPRIDLVESRATPIRSPVKVRALSQPAP